VISVLFRDEIGREPIAGSIWRTNLLRVLYKLTELLFFPLLVGDFSQMSIKAESVKLDGDEL
jgi:hypothetical protein